ncbi:MAG: hypothetical protein AB7V50_04080 [Vampirovibrionia bacterium]
MRQIELLMRELNLTDEIINSTVQKINLICSNNLSTSYNNTNSFMTMLGNGDGNGSQY